MSVEHVNVLLCLCAYGCACASACECILLRVHMRVSVHTYVCACACACVLIVPVEMASFMGSSPGAEVLGSNTKNSYSNISITQRKEEEENKHAL